MLNEYTYILNGKPGPGSPHQHKKYSCQWWSGPWLDRSTQFLIEKVQLDYPR
jgi:hypothetical protein